MGCYNQEWGINIFCCCFEVLLLEMEASLHKNSPLKLCLNSPRASKLQSRQQVKVFEVLMSEKCRWLACSAPFRESRRSVVAAEPRVIAQYRSTLAPRSVCLRDVSSQNTWYLRLTLFFNQVMQDTTKPRLVTSPNWLWHAPGNQITCRTSPWQRGHGLNRSFITLIRRIINVAHSIHPHTFHTHTKHPANAPDDSLRLKFTWR